ncbi:nitronate monooxygenase [Pseudomonas sp. CAN2814]|nr:nitronate monooxygenase [Pseudomonas sp. CAN1]MDN6861057.1 nitronate monooxygenase [Pseudomonas sp. CAN1]
MPTMRTRLTELLGIRYPIVEGGMQWLGRARLAAAVSNAGGLGMVTARTQPTPDDLRREIDLTRQLTDQPFAVNLTLSYATQGVSYDGWIEAILGSGIRIVETAGNNPRAVVEKFKEAGVTVIHKCTSVRHALSAQRYGVDVISIDGFEAAGHPGEDDVPGLILIPAAVRQLDIPVIASGGIANGRSMAAALALGADGVNMGTRFTLTEEAEMHDGIKQALLAADERNTVLINRTLKYSARFFSNAITREILALEHRPGGATFEDLRPLMSGQRGRTGLVNGEIDAGLVCASPAIGLIDDIPSCAELIQRMVRECREALSEAQNKFLP